MRLFQEELAVLNVGLGSFADEIVQAGGKATKITWAPPGGGDPAVGKALARLVNDAKIDAANQKAFAAYLSADPTLVGIALAREAIVGMNERRILHSGPPIAWAQMCGPAQGAIIGAIIFEGWAKDPEAAKRLAESGEIAFAPCHHHNAVGPMAGIISPSMPVWVVRDPATGRRTFSNLNEGLGKVLRYGANSPEVLERLSWMSTTLYRVLQMALAETDGIQIKPLIAQALNMGDEVHNRNAAASMMLLRRLVQQMLASRASRDDVASAIAFIAGNDHFFLNISMAACKLMLDAARNIPGSSMVTAMARNGVMFGIQVSGTGDRWFTAPAPVVNGLYFPGYSIADAAPDLGDSAITETAGLGGFAMAAAPAIVNFVGGTPADAIANTRAMGHITIGRNGGLLIPTMNFAGTPAGIDIRKVVDTGILPVINTGIAHREAGIGQIGAGITHAPLDCFSQAVTALAALTPEK
jgi:Protein of unknown function (DUF1116)